MSNHRTIPVMQVAVANCVEVRLTIVPVDAKSLHDAEALWREQVLQSFEAPVVAGALFPTELGLQQDDLMEKVLQINDPVQLMGRLRFMIGQQRLTDPMISDGFWQFIKFQ